jgi:replicative DNA helicase Mcm
MEDIFVTSEYLTNYLEENHRNDLIKLLDREEVRFILDFQKLSEEAQKDLNERYIETAYDITSFNDILQGVLAHLSVYSDTPSVVKNASLEFIGLIHVNGIVISVTAPHSIITRAYYMCPKCEEILVIPQIGLDLRKPDKCSSCGGKKGFILMETESKWDDYQELLIQENPEEVYIGVTPRVIRARVRGKQMIDNAKPGDLVDVSCALVPVPTTSKNKRVFGWCFDVNHIEVLSKDAYNVELSEEDIKEIIQISKFPNLIIIFRDSVFPILWGIDHIKEGLLLTMFGAPDRKIRGISFRGTINMAMIGDPSTGKTKLLEIIKLAAPKAIYTSGTGATGVGLTAAAVQDQMGWRLEAGALVLADGGICLIDELEKMRDEDREKILEAMSVQTVSVNKATIHTTLNAKTSIIGAANPVGGRYNEHDLVSENINLSPTLLSRFDLIFIMKDKPSREQDERIAEKVLEMEEEDVQLLSYDIIKKYILYAKQINPVLDEDAKGILKIFYLTLREMSIGSNSPIAITVRQLEGLRRLTQASARLHLREVATVEDAKRAIALMEKSMEEIMTDPDTGEIDVDITTTGLPKSQKDKMDKILYVLRQMGEDVHIEELIQQVEPLGISPEETKKFLTRMLSMSGINLYNPDGQHQMWRAI